MLRQRLFSGLHLGLLRAGERLPSANELSAELAIDRRVILEAYRELEREGLVELRQRSGIFFSQSAPGFPGRDLSPNAAWAVDVVAQGLAQGIPAPKFADRFHDYLSTLRMRAVCVECNTDQVSAICDELTSDYGFESVGLEVDDLLANSSQRPELRRADVLVTTTFHASEVQEIATKVGRPWLVVTFRTDILPEIARLLPRQAVYFVVLDQRYADKLEKVFSNVEGAANFHALVQGRDDLAHIPLSAPAYITRAARARLSDKLPSDAQLLERVMPEERLFSKESANELLAFVIRANIAALAAKALA